MNIDRVFTKDGFGLIVTGTVNNGMTKVGDELELLPKKEVLKIRSIQTHGNITSNVKVGDRAAINLKSKKENSNKTRRHSSFKRYFRYIFSRNNSSKSQFK